MYWIVQIILRNLKVGATAASSSLPAALAPATRTGLQLRSAFAALNYPSDATAQLNPSTLERPIFTSRPHTLCPQINVGVNTLLKAWHPNAEAYWNNRTNLEYIFNEMIDEQKAYDTVGWASEWGGEPHGRRMLAVTFGSAWLAAAQACKLATQVLALPCRAFSRACACHPSWLA
jgi:hypothetical protein